MMLIPLTVAIVSSLGRPIGAVTVIVVVVVSYLIFSLFASIISVGIDTVFVCYCEDLERNKEDGLYISPDLHRLFQSQKQAHKEREVINH